MVMCHYVVYELLLFLLPRTLLRGSLCTGHISSKGFFLEVCLEKSCADSHSISYLWWGYACHECLWRTEGRFRKLILSSAMWAPEFKLRSLSALLRWLHLLTQIVIEIFINLGNIRISVLNVTKCDSNLRINDICLVPGS